MALCGNHILAGEAKAGKHQCNQPVLDDVADCFSNLHNRLHQDEQPEGNSVKYGGFKRKRDIDF